MEAVVPKELASDGLMPPPEGVDEREWWDNRVYNSEVAWLWAAGMTVLIAIPAPFIRDVSAIAVEFLA